MVPVQLSDVQRANLSMLMTLRDNIRRDPVSACCRFGLHAEQATLFAELSVEHILALVANVGQECLFLPREDLPALLKVPLPLSGAITSVRPLKVATASAPHALTAQRAVYARSISVGGGA